MPQQMWCTTFVGGPLLSHYIYRAPLQVTLAHQGLGIMTQMPEQMWRKMSEWQQGMWKCQHWHTRRLLWPGDYYDDAWADAAAVLIVFPHPMVCFLVTVELLPVYKLHWHQGIIIMMMLPEQTWCTAFVTAFVVEVRLSPSLSLSLSLSLRVSLFLSLSMSLTSLAFVGLLCKSH